MRQIGCVRCEKFQHDFVARTFAIIAPVQPVLHQVSCSNEMIPNAPKHKQTHQNMSLRSNVVDRCVCREKFWHDFLARTFALISPVQPILHQVSCSNEMIPNGPKHCETHQNMSLGSNGVDWVCALWTISTQLCGMNFCINCTSSACVVPSFMK